MSNRTQALQPVSRGQAFAFGLNPYGLTYYLGLQGAGGPRANPKAAGLEGFIAIATELGGVGTESGYRFQLAEIEVYA